MYDTFSNDYDRFVNWENRLAFEMPFLEAQLIAAGCKRILDSATGTGMHVIELCRRGYLADGADLSPGMIDKARSNARQAGVDAEFKVAGFGQLAEAFGDHPGYDAVLCLGNSLPHLLTAQEIGSALKDFAACLRPGGLLFIQNRNFDAVLTQRERWMEPQSHWEGDQEWIFLRFYDFEPEGLINFHVVILHRDKIAPWEQKINSTRLYPLLNEELALMMSQSFIDIHFYGGMKGDAYHPQTSGNLIVTARRKIET
jgi:glycine/sarcosine N-methyltransferase